MIRPAQRPTVRELWKSWLAECLPKVVKPDQIEEHRQTFYAGAVAIMGAFTDLVEGKPVPVDEIEYWRRLRHDLVMHTADLQRRGI